MKTFRSAIMMFLLFTILTGLFYPALITGIAQALFTFKANGSIIQKDGIAVGSELIGQLSDTAVYFSPRPSAIKYNPLPSGGSNYGLTSAKLKESFIQNKKHFINLNELDSTVMVPSEMLFASGSGLDPHISPAAAILQAGRIARARHFSIGQQNELLKLIEMHTESPQFHILGDERVNVLLLNLDLDKIR